MEESRNSREQTGIRMNLARTTRRRPPGSQPWTRLNKVGLSLMTVLSVGNVTSALGPTPEGGTGPPLGILLAGSVLGVIGTVACVLGWTKGNRPAARLAAITVVLATVSAMPAFFVDVPAGIKAMVAAIVVLTVTAVVLTFSGPGGRRELPDPPVHGGRG